MGRAPSIAALVCCGAFLFVRWMLGQIACGTDTSDCAESAVKDVIYRGSLERAAGSALANTAFTVEFASRRDTSRVGGFVPDDRGNYCILWARERITPYVYV